MKSRSVISLVLVYVVGYRHGMWSQVDPKEAGMVSLEQQAVATPKVRLENQLNNDDGWSTIDVFFGKREILDRTFTPPNREWFSQALQDKMISGLFREKKGGYFVDLASNHPWYFSNTLALERKYQWKGLCIEANDMYWRGLSFRECKVIAAAVGGTRLQELQFAMRSTTAEEGMFGGIVSNTTDNKPHDKGSTVIKTVFTVSLGEILQRNGAPSVIDYMSLDVEGAELLVMHDFPFHRYRFLVMTVERPTQELKQIFEKNGYVQLRDEICFGETIWGCQQSINNGTLDVSSLKQYQATPYDYKHIIELANYPKKWVALKEY